MASISLRQQNNPNLETMIQVVGSGGGGGGGTVGKVLSPYSLHHHHHHYHNHLDHQPFHIFQKTKAHTSLSISSTSSQNLKPKNIGHSVNQNSDANINGDQSNIEDNASATSESASPRFLDKANRYNSYHYDLLPEKIFDTDDEDEDDEDDEYIYHDGKDGLSFLNYHSKQKQKPNTEKDDDSVNSPNKLSSLSDDGPKAQTNQFLDNSVSTQPSETVQSSNNFKSGFESNQKSASANINSHDKIQSIQLKDCVQLKNNQLINMINQGKLVNNQQVFSVSPVNLNIDKNTSLNNVVLPQMTKWDSVGESSKLTIIHCSNVPSSMPNEKVGQILPVMTVKKIKLIPLSNETARTLSVQNLTADKSLNKKAKNERKKRLTKNQRMESCQKLRKEIWLQLLKQIQSRKDVILLNAHERRLRSQNIAFQCHQWTLHNRLKNY